MSVIRQQNCTNCKFSARIHGDKLACRRQPPVGMAVFGYREEMEPSTGKKVMIPFPAGKSNSFPEVEPEWWCGEHAPKIVAARLRDPAEGVA